MDTNELRFTARLLGLRAKTYLRFLTGIVGIALVSLGAFNMLVAPVVNLTPLAPYRGIGVVVFERGAYYLGDILVIAVGAVLAWLA